ncbi:MAG: putative Subtilisin [Promethearchaeota archaeon]|jgi:hypothetical protein|nr:MAG: putative Subtilisin [Candidatus Lokiarchaeota archaeon]
MRNLNIKIKHKKFISSFIIIVLIFSISFPFLGRYVFTGNNQPKSENVNRRLKPNLKNSKYNKPELMKWKENKDPYDTNHNGIDDDLDKKILNLTNSGANFEYGSGQNNYDSHLGDFKGKTEFIEKGKSAIIIQFPDIYRNKIVKIFREYKGVIDQQYDTAINGFSGEISYRGLGDFRDKLDLLDIPFFLEENGKIKSNLYYTGRNMNLRPYVWNKLGYDGDESSSIAIIDSGIDDSHNFHNGYRDGDFKYKIVGWKDFTENNQSTPYDDNQHGSHVAGIAAGEGIGASTSDSNTYYITKNIVLNHTGLNVQEGTISIDLASFEIINDTKDIDLIFQFDDYTQSNDDVNATAIMLYKNSVIHSYSSKVSDDWVYNPSGEEIDTTNKIGRYHLRLNLTYSDEDEDGAVRDPDIAFRAIFDYPFDPNTYGSGNIWKGVANDSHLVGIKVLGKSGYGDFSDVVSGVEWAIENKRRYNISIISMSLGGMSRVTLNDAVNTAMEEGIVVVASAGNDGPGENRVGSPGQAENIIAVAATNSQDNITYYSSQGGTFDSQRALKPDIAAPGGSVNDLTIFSSDTNDNDAEGIYTDGFFNDLTPLQGTSMSAPAVSGAASLLIEAMGGASNWDYSFSQAKLVKALLLMTATETFPLLRESYGRRYSPELNRGGKDPHEGYGRINIDMAIQAFTNYMEIGGSFSRDISSSLHNSFAPHGVARNVDLSKDKAYRFQLDIPKNSDFDLFLYEGKGTHLGEPILAASSISPVKGRREEIYFSPEVSGTFYLVAKAVSGNGTATVETSFIEDISVSINAPKYPNTHGFTQIEAKAKYYGDLYSDPINNLNFSLTLDGTILNSTVIPNLNPGDSYSLNYDWNPGFPDTHNISALADHIDGEAYTGNNEKTKTVYSRQYFFFEDFEEDLSKWETLEGKWHITDGASEYPNSSYSPTHSMWWGEEDTGHYPRENNQRGKIETIPINLTNAGSDLYLGFYHWREAKYVWDISRVRVHYKEEWWETELYQIDYYKADIEPWTRELYNLSFLAGLGHVQIEFSFSVDNNTISQDDDNYRGWLIDNVGVFGILDDIAPKWIEIPTDQYIYQGNPFRYEVNATDPTGIAFYSVNDTNNFQVNDNGIITNKKSLERGEYWLEIRSYDSYYNYVSAIIKVEVGIIQIIPSYEIIILASILGMAFLIVLLRKRYKLIN